jgi:hypothetical protein
MAVGLEEQLGSVGRGLRHDGQPLGVADGHVLLRLEAEDVGVEAVGFVLVVDEDAGDVDARGHGSPRC